MKLGDSVRARQRGGAAKSGAGGSRVISSARRPVQWRRIIPLTFAALLIPFAVGYAFSVFVLFPAPKVVGGGGIAVPNLVGHTVDDAQQMLATANLGELVTTMKLPHPTAPVGEVIAQDPLPGQQLKQGSKVSVSVSSGAPELKIPDVSGFTAEAAEAVLRKMGFNTQRLDEMSAAASRGTVIRLDPGAGTNIKLPATITMVISAGPPAIDSLGSMRDTIHIEQR